MDVLTQIFVWVLASVVASLLAGFYIGRATSHSEQERLAQEERKKALTALVDVLNSVQDLSTDMDSRNSEMHEVQRHVGDLHATGELEQVRQELLGQVVAVIESNQRLEEDLVFARCRMEQQAEELDRTRREAHTDALSGVANRKAFDDRLKLLLGYQRRLGTPFSLLLADLDHFKWINDTYGHQAGDRVIHQLGSLLTSQVRENDFVARYGGDEFAVLLANADLEASMKIAERICVETTHINFGAPTSEQTAVTLSLGLAVAQAGDTTETLFKRADEALYASKKGGRNQVRCQTAPAMVSSPAEFGELAALELA